MNARHAAISIDLDEVHHYAAIHGIDLPGARHAVYDIALSRIQEFCDANSLRCTLFAVGADMARKRNASGLRAMAEAGHEIANHSLDHRYDLTRLGRAEQRRQVETASMVLERATGHRPRGFRAPGYLVTDQLLEVVAASGALYDSSVFPCPAYYAAKAGVVGAMRLLGRRSASIVDDPRVLLAPTAPYRIGTPYQRPGDGLLELPIQVTPGLRLPVIGTSLILAGQRGALALARRVAHGAFVNLELHGIDFLDAWDGLKQLAPNQRDLWVPVARKLAVLNRVVETLKQRGFGFERLCTSAQRLA